MSDLGPPWVIFSDGGRPLAILPAGRPGEVADVRKVPPKIVYAIVAAANQPIRDANVALVKLGTRLEALMKKTQTPTPSRRAKARKAK